MTAAVAAPPDPRRFLGVMRGFDGRPLLETLVGSEAYRAKILIDALGTLEPVEAGGRKVMRPKFNRVLTSRGKKNYKSTDLCIAALFCFLAVPSDAGNDSAIVANDLTQAKDDLAIVKKLIELNPMLSREVRAYTKEIRRRDGKGTLTVLPAKNVASLHGKSFLFIGYDEIWGYRDYAIFEALAPDPNRLDVREWIASYASIYAKPGVPIFDFLQAARAGSDPRLFCSWYSADFTTDPVFADKPPEERANPSMASWRNPSYLPEERRRLPSSRYRRLHLNLQGQPEGAAFAAEHVLASIVQGRRRLPYEPGRRYVAFVDMSGGSNDDATFAIAHRDTAGREVLDLVMSQGRRPPFNPRDAVTRFAEACSEYQLTSVTGDAYAGETFRRDFEAAGIHYTVSTKSASDLYEEFEPRLNAGEVELLDCPELQEQLLTLVWLGGKITHERGAHDDWANAAVGALNSTMKAGTLQISDMVLQRAGRAVNWRAGSRQIHAHF
jgi:hypothetical protein